MFVKKSISSGKRQMGEQPDRNLGLELVRATEAAALAAVRLAGRSQKEAGDQPVLKKETNK
jgi:hypothetical protein